VTLKNVADRLESAAESDPGLLIALRAAYRGRHDVQDALWWRAHPLSESPGGHSDPLADLDDPGHEERELSRLLAQDAEALDQVLVSFRDWPGADEDAAPDPALPAYIAPEIPPQSAPCSSLLVAGAATVGLLLGVAVLALVTT